MVVKHEATVRNRKEERLAKVKAGMPPHRQPKIPSSSQRQCKNQPGDNDIGHTDQVFAMVPPVNGPEREGKADGGSPEPNSSRQSVLHVSPKQELLKQPNKHERHCPQCSPAEKGGSVKGQVSE